MAAVLLLPALATLQPPVARAMTEAAETAHASPATAVLYVEAGAAQGSGAFSSVSAAVAQASPGARILVKAGSYREKVTITKPVTVEAYPEGADVELVWETQVPYEHVLECSYDSSSSDGTSSSTSSSSSSSDPAGLAGSSSSGSDRMMQGSRGEVVIRGLRVRHYSKSVANNYAVYITAGSPVLEACDISSSSGTGVCVEGARAPLLRTCRVHNCASHGIAVYGAISDTPSGLGTEPVLRDSEVDGNKLDGLLVRSGAAVDVQQCRLHDNGGFGINVQDAGGRFEGNVVANNGKGAARVVPSFDLELDLDSLKSVNQLAGQLLLK